MVLLKMQRLYWQILLLSLAFFLNSEAMRMPFSSAYDQSFDLLAVESHSSEVALPIQIQKPPVQVLPAPNQTLVPDESQQVSKVVSHEMKGLAGGHGGHGGGHGGGHHKDYGHDGGHESGFTKDSGHHSGDGFKKNSGHSSKSKGNHAKNQNSGSFDKGGKKFSSKHHKKGYFGKDISGKKGSIGHKHGSSGHHNKGTKSKGFKNEYFKEESGVSKKFYEDADNKKYNKKYDHLDSFFQSEKGGSDKGGSHKGGKSHGSKEKKGFHKKGSSKGGKHSSTKKHGKTGNFHHNDVHSKKSGGKKGYGGHHGAHSNQLVTVTKTTDGKPIQIIAQPSNNGYTAVIKALPDGATEFETITQLPPAQDMQSEEDTFESRKIEYVPENTSPVPIVNVSPPGQIHYSEEFDNPHGKENEEIEQLRPTISKNKKHKGIIEAVVIKNGEKIQISAPDNSKQNMSSAYSLDSNVMKFLEMLPDLDVMKKLRKKKDDEEAQESDRSEVFETTTAPIYTTTTAPPDVEIVLRKKSPNSRGYSYLKKSTSPLYSNCTGDSKDGCTTFTQQSRSSFTVEYTDTDYDDDEEFPGGNTDYINSEAPQDIEIDLPKPSEHFLAVVEASKTTPVPDTNEDTTESQIEAKPSSLDEVNSATIDLLKQIVFDSKKIENTPPPMTTTTESTTTTTTQKSTTTSQSTTTTQQATTAVENTTKAQQKKRKKARQSILKSIKTPADRIATTPLILNIKRKRLNYKQKRKLMKKARAKPKKATVLDSSPFIIPKA